jgi:hypothetical protein
MKLFNMVMEELGPGFLRRGIIASVPELMDFFREQAPVFRAAIIKATLNGTPVAPDLLVSGRALYGQSIMLSVIEAGGN